MFLVPISHPGITLRRITMLSGSTEFCEEFLDGVDVGDDAVVGEVNGGWAVASTQLYHERRAVGQGSEFASGSGSEGGTSNPVDYMDLAEKTGQADNQRVQEMAGRVLVHRVVAEQLVDHVYRAVRDGVLPPTAGTLIRLFHAETLILDLDTALAIAGTAGVVGENAEGMEAGLRYLSRQNVAIGGGTTEMARNVIGERVLGFPREHAADRGVPFNQVRHGQSS
jgi:alkylation response protein AidB-like acyl-CoA dehydrogenase